MSADPSRLRSRYEVALHDAPLESVGSPEYRPISTRIGIQIDSPRSTNSSPTRRLSNSNSRVPLAFSLSDMASLSAHQPSSAIPAVTSSSRRQSPSSSNDNISQGTQSTRSTVKSSKSNRVSLNNFLNTSSSPQATSRSVNSGKSRSRQVPPSKNEENVVTLKQFQHAIEQRLIEWVDELQARAAERQSDFRECELLMQHAFRQMNRYKRLTCLTIEAMLELKSEISDEERRHAAYEESMRAMRDREIPALQRDIGSMHRLHELLQHFISRAESRRSEEEALVRHQIEQQQDVSLRQL